MNLLVSTPRYLLRYNTDSRQTYIVDDGRGEYYGISWFDGADSITLSHSNLDNASLQTFVDYADSEVGVLSCGHSLSQPFLSQPHQILCLNEVVLATNTGRNCLSVVNSKDWSVRQYRYSRAIWDRCGSGIDVGNHINSVTEDDEFIYLLANNFGKGSFALKVSKGDYKLVGTTHFECTGLHNIWLRDKSTTISCHSGRQAIVDLESGVPLWVCDDELAYTRGLAATPDSLFVGVSEFKERAGRSNGMTGLWILDSGSFKEKDYHSIGPFGGVNELRLLEVADLCHGRTAMPLTSQLLGQPVQSYWASEKITELKNKRIIATKWEMVSENLISLTHDSFRCSEAGLGMALARNISAQDVKISATLDVSKNIDGLSCIIARYKGPEDRNMIAVTLAREADYVSRLAFWTNIDGNWSEKCGCEFYGRVADVELIVIGNCGKVYSDKKLLLEANGFCEDSGDGRVGVRISKAEVSNFQVQTL
ncbi:hypothetical protein [Caulobacter sp. S45]|uniref:hypothetical protein n=1 Tax=Caulobacter sp. S45 TaxID=1641861 RepID=UPI00131CC05F|nr:hypothetical protein [Caulobacter sp. S45]